MSEVILSGQEQKSHSYYHRIAYTGGYVVNFDTKTKKWGEKTTYDAISHEENMEDVLFAVGSHLLLLLYSRFDGLKYHGLYEWAAASHNWQKIPGFEVRPPSQIANLNWTSFTIINLYRRRIRKPNLEKRAKMNWRPSPPLMDSIS